MTDVTFHPIDDDLPNTGPDLTADECPCPKPDDQYLMQVDCGTASLVHAACGKRPAPWAGDAVSMAPVPVTLHWHTSTDYWTGEVDAYGDITINGLTGGAA